MLGRKTRSLNKATEELNKLKDENQEAFIFLKKIEEGDFYSTNKAEDVKLKDNLFYSSLLSLQQKLQTNYELEKQHKWTMEGLAKFAEILRSNTEQGKNYYSYILSYLVKYLEINQGALFLLNDDQEEDVYLEMVATYAYNKQKYLTKRVSIGQGLVGQCYLEKDITYLTEIPQGYISITSGLGDANPDSILIVPLMTEDKVLGVIELASFESSRISKLISLRS